MSPDSVSDDVVAEFLRRLSEIPDTKRGGGVALLLAQLPEGKAELLRRAAIPHHYDATILGVLDPERSAAELEQICDELEQLAFVIETPEGYALHDEPRAYLFRQWLERDTSKSSEFSEISARLADWFAGAAERSQGEAREAYETERMFHRIGSDQRAGFADFVGLLTAARDDFRLARCETLINLVAEYEDFLDDHHHNWLAYYRARLAADQRHFDQAENALHRLLEDEQLTNEFRSTVLARLGHVYSSRREWITAISRYEEALEICEATDSENTRYRLLHDIGVAHREQGQLDEAEGLLRESITLAEEHTDARAMADGYNSLGSLHLRRGEAEAAVAACEKAVEILEEQGERFRAAQALNNLGMAYARAGQHDKGEETLERSLVGKREAGDTVGQAMTLNNLVEVYRTLGKRAKAVEASLEALRLLDEAHDHLRAGIASRNLAAIYRDQQETDLATEAYDGAIERLERAGAGDELAVTVKLRDALSAKRGLPWWAWISIGVATLVLLLLIALAILNEYYKGASAFVILSPDNRRFASSQFTDDGWVVNVDGEPNGPYESLLHGTPIFSRDGRHVAFAALKDGRWVIVSDIDSGDPPGALKADEQPYANLEPYNLALSPDGRRIAFAASDDDGPFVVVDGQRGATYDEIIQDTVLFDPTGARITYRVRRGEQRALVVDSEPQRWVDKIGLNLDIFSADGKRIAYSAEIDGRFHMIVDGVPGPGYDEMTFGMFAPYGDSFAYAGRRDNSWHVVVNDVEGPPYEQVTFGWQSFAADGSSFAYVGARQGRYYLVADSMERELAGPPLEMTPVVSNDGRRIAVGVLRGERWVIDEGDRVSREYDGILAGTPRYGPNGRRLAFGALVDGQWRMVVDGVEQAAFDAIGVGPELFSPDGSTLAYIGQVGDEYYVVIDGERRFGPYANVSTLHFEDSGVIRFVTEDADRNYAVHEVEP